ncbi:hypothetical protein C8F01DRAFT_1345924 [Mycena amicta]|nr:hypothetical protein C8F01DRAFT_1345924 [Mycena amicta]
MEESELSSDEELPAPSIITTPASTSKPTAPSARSKPPLPKPLPSNTSAAINLAAEKTGTLRLLDSLFGGNAVEWGGCESVGSDVDEEELLKIGGSGDGGVDGEDGIDSSADSNRSCAPSKVTKLKDLLAPRVEDPSGGFSLLGHLDLELDEHKFAHLTAPNASAAEVIESQLPQPTHVFVLTRTHAPITLDPKQPLFFPLPATTSHDLKARQHDILDVARDAGCAAHFCKTETVMCMLGELTTKLNL